MYSSTQPWCELNVPSRVVLRLRGEDYFVLSSAPTHANFQIARNRLGLNDKAHELAVEEAQKEKELKEKQRLEEEKKKAKAKRS